MAKRKNQLSNPQLTLIDALEANGGEPLNTLSYEDTRKVLEDAQAINLRKLAAEVEDAVFPGGATGDVVIAPLLHCESCCYRQSYRRKWPTVHHRGSHAARFLL